MTSAPVHVTVWTDGGADKPTAVFVHNVITWGDDTAYGFAAQRALAAHARLLLMDRRGYGRSPDTERSDYAVDAEDIITLLGDGAHLVGHGYGGVGALLAASQRPDLVRSLALVQPGALRVAGHHPVVAEALARARQGTADLPEDLSPQDFLRASTEGLGLPMPEPTTARLRAARTSMRERPCWDADIPLRPIADAPWPTLLVSGDWAGAPELYRRYAGEPLIACAEVIAETVGARHLRVPGFYPHTQQPELVNQALLRLWDGAPTDT
ncbi:alpha/beta fold hydrolase [Streptomyces hygroscopicus]|uniref:alpha/beta fold hydrolase n=1 Tax=Streptomyces hygroscopicus TaxID=1912 RepID=UPI0036807E90